MHQQQYSALGGGSWHCCWGAAFFPYSAAAKPLNPGGGPVCRPRMGAPSSSREAKRNTRCPSPVCPQRSPHRFSGNPRYVRCPHYTSISLRTEEYSTSLTIAPRHEINVTYTIWQLQPNALLLVCTYFRSFLFFCLCSVTG